MTDSATPFEPDLEYEPDPIFIDSLRESGWILLMWACCFVWTLVTCLSHGYQQDVNPQTFKTVYGIPAWVAYGIVLPWLVADVVTIWFCIFKMKDGDLGESDDEPVSASSAAEKGGAA